MTKPDNLDAGDILVAEFQYIAQIAHNDSEDRARVSTFYLVSVGSVLAALLSARSANTSALINGGFMAVFWLLTMLGWATMFQLTLLRRSWYGNIAAMNQIKTYYGEHFKDIALKSAFAWTNDTKPRPFKPYSITTILALQVGLVSSVMFAAGIVFFLLLAFGELEAVHWIFTLVCALAHLAVQAVAYLLVLRFVTEPRQKKKPDTKL